MTALIPHEDEYGRWDPLAPLQVASLLGASPVHWCLGGGYALEWFVERSWRDHGDVDVVVFREGMSALREHLADWDLVLADSGTLRPWQPDSPLPNRVHDIWCRQGTGPWRFQFMVVDAEDGEWLFRRDSRVRGPVESFSLTIHGMPVLAPEIQLLYKSKRPNRPKDQLDAETTIPALDADRSNRLRAWLGLFDPGHPWLEPTGLLGNSDQEASAR